MNKNIHDLLEEISKSKDKEIDINVQDSSVRGYAGHVDLYFKIDDFPVSQRIDHLVFIGNELAPSSFEERCLMLSKDYDWEFTMENGRHVLIPKLRV